MTDGSAIRVLVLDLESRLSREALALLPDNRGGASIERALLQEIASVSLLGFSLGDGGISDASLVGLTTDDERSILSLIEAALTDLGECGLLVTHNGVSHDLPLCLRRCMARWMHDCPEIQRWQDIGRERHVDTMLRTARRGSPIGPSLTDLSASLGIVAGLQPGGRGRRIDPLEVKGSFDVVRTALAFLHLEALRRRDSQWLALCWRDLAAFLLSPSGGGNHLRPIARQGLEIARAAGI
ncbi:hypothetical protein EQZ23_06875 [Sphingomonas sp. UV9]|uniref:hypothetical protein n=1 Tax=Sphingomonas sp. UV9 TaxID=1851410 RepID=UPI000FFBFAC7|nr:hypothetical protein [Sphingomonas sp. UV9]RXD04859.1 hypothetical protein EQZ23_06875 [Sphingomonas sp. UV9]